MDQIEIRKMREEDLPAVLGVLKHWNMDPRPASNETPDPERDSIDIDNGFVAVDEGRIVGTCSYLACTDDLAETASMAVLPEYRGRNIGYRLQVARLDEIRSKGFKRLRTETDRPETIAWYKRKFGYREVGQNPKKHDFSLHHVDRWVVLELEL